MYGLDRRCVLSTRFTPGEGLLVLGLCLLLVAGCSSGGGGGGPILAPSTGTLVSGEIPADTAWTVSEDPIRVVGDVVIPPGVTLRIGPGVEVIFTTPEEPASNGFSFRIQGALEATGTGDAPVIFRGEPGPEARWGSLHFEATSRPAVFGDGDRFLLGSKLEHCIFEDATESAVFLDRASPWIHRCQFRSNEARTDRGETLLDGDKPRRRVKGGALHAYRPAGRLEVSDCEFVENFAPGAGGAVAVVEALTDEIAIERCRFTGNRVGIDRDGRGAGKVGGAVYLINSPRSVLRDCVFEENFAEGGGAVHLSFRTDVVIEGCVFEANVGDRVGGAIFASHQSRPAIRSNLFLRNRADAAIDVPFSSTGGAVFVWSNDDPRIEGNRFIENRAAFGGAIATNRNNPSVYSGRLLILENEFDGNSSAGPGASTLFFRKYDGIVLKRNNIVNYGQVAVEAHTDNDHVLIRARDNWWGTPVKQEIERAILHFVDDTTRDEVLFEPFASTSF